MTVQTIEINGERYVILAEHDFLALQQGQQSPSGEEASSIRVQATRYRDVEPLRVGGIPASELLLKDRR